MHIVVATDGSLDPTDTVALVAPLAKGAEVTVLTAVEIPRRLLADLRAVYGERSGPPVDSDGEYVGISPETPGVTFDFPGEDAIIDRYLSTQLEERTGPRYRAIADAISDDLESGSLAPGVRLPPHRDLAAVFPVEELAVDRVAC